MPSPDTDKPASRDAGVAEVVRLTAKVSLILAELDVVVRQMSAMLREKAHDDDAG